MSLDFIGDFIGDTIGGITGAKQAGEAGQRAAELQYQSASEGIAETRRQFDLLTSLMSPYVQAGQQSLAAQQDILGLSGAAAQQGAVSGMEQSPFFQAMARQGEEGILQNASATGGLRGGNVQGALAQFRPSLLNQFIQQRFQNLGGVTGMGQASAAGQGAAGQQTGVNISNLLGQQGAAMAGGELARGAVVGNTFGDVMQIAGAVAGAKKAGIF